MVKGNYIIFSWTRSSNHCLFVSPIALYADAAVTYYTASATAAQLDASIPTKYSFSLSLYLSPEPIERRVRTVASVGWWRFCLFCLANDDINVQMQQQSTEKKGKNANSPWVFDSNSTFGKVSVCKMRLDWDKTD